MNRIYLDHAATSPLRPEARAAMEEGFAIWANPSSPHAEGRKARAALEGARARVKAALGWEGEVIFTSGASEAAAIALTRTKAGARLVSAVEHDCILGAVPDAKRLPVRSDGAIDVEALSMAVQRGRPLVAIQHVNSETGNAQDLGAIAQLLREAGGLLLADCAQSAGKMPLPPCDMAMVSAHKFGGPIGIGALLVRDYAMLEPVGGHERGYRRGTENLPGAMGMAAALEACPRDWFSEDLMAALKRLLALADQRGKVLNGWLDQPTGLINAIAHPSMSASAQVMRLDMTGFSVSQGSACSSGTMKTSSVLTAMQVDEGLASRTIRVSLGWNTTANDLDAFAAAWASLT